MREIPSSESRRDSEEILKGSEENLCNFMDILENYELHAVFGKTCKVILEKFFPRKIYENLKKLIERKLEEICEIFWKKFCIEEFLERFRKNLARNEENLS